MSASRTEDYYSYGNRRSPQAGELQTGGLFQSEKGGRTVLPPLSTAFPTSHFPVDSYTVHYSQPRSSGSPARNYDSNMMYGNCPHSISSTTNYYEDYSLHYPQYNTCSAPRSMAHAAYEPHTRRHGTPTSSAFGGMEDRWSHASYTSVSHAANSNTLYSPTASYPQHYTPQHPPEFYGYNSLSTHDAPHIATHSMDPRIHATSSHRPVTPARLDHQRVPSPGRSAIISPTSPTYMSPHLESFHSQQESAPKKKRRRADANQLKILNEVWERTAFPSTEERAELAKRLDMSPRSVQIWFQNKRQNLRQNAKQSANLTSSLHQPFSVSPTDEYLEDAHYQSSAYLPVLTRSGPSSRSAPIISASHRRARS